MRFTFFIAVATALTVVGLVSSASATVSDPPLCGWVASPTVTFDVTPLMQPSGSFYTVPDAVRNYTYYMNLCTSFNMNPVFDKCPDVSVPAWQRNDEDCHALANGSITDPWTWSYIDSTDPSTGVSLKYFGGDRCGGAGAPRSFTLNMYCSPFASFNPIAGSVVTEEGCAYELNIETVFACPTSCVRGGNPLSLCSGNGICEFDTDAAVPRCFCYDGWSGEDCGSQPSSSDDGIGAIGVFLILILIVLIALNIAAILMLYRIRSFRPQRELNQSDAEHMASSGTAPLPDTDAEREPSVTGVSGAVFTIE